MVFTAYSCEQIYMKRINVAGGGLSNGNAYAVIEILYNDEQMEEVDGVWYKEFGKNPISKRIGNEVEWCDDDTFKILEDGEYVEDEDKEEEEEEEEEEEDEDAINSLEKSLDMWIKIQSKTNPLFTEDEELEFLKEECDDIRIVKIVFDKRYTDEECLIDCYDIETDTIIYKYEEQEEEEEEEDEDKEEVKNKIYIKRGQQLGLPNEKFYEVPWDASDEMLLDIQRWWEGK